MTSRQVDGFTAGPVNHELIPTNQQEYITSLSDVAPRSRPQLQPVADASRPSNIFGINSIASARQRFAQFRTFLPAAAIALVLIGSVVGLASWRSNKSAGAQKSGVRSSIETTEEDGELTERRPMNILDYQVAPDLPRFIRISDMGLTSRVRRVGVGEDTALKLPGNIHDVGWYENSVKPGEEGAVVLTGHAMGPTKPGIFYDIQQLQAGDRIEVETGSGQVFSYYVVKLEAFNADQPLAPLLASAVPGSPGLNLVTETGSFDESANTYDQRLVVFAVQDGVTNAPSQQPATPVQSTNSN